MTADPIDHTFRYELQEGPDRGSLLSYTDQTLGSGGSLQTLLFVHGNPECSRIFHRTIRYLQGWRLPLTRLITCDHLGFGLSSPAPRLLGPADHGANLSRLLAHLAPEWLTMVVHDWGGPIGLGALLDQPQRLRKLLILNSSIFPLSPRCSYRNYPFSLLSWAWLAALVPDRFWGRFAAGAIACRATGRGELLRDLLRRPLRRDATTERDNPYLAQFTDPANVAGSRYLARLAGRWCDPASAGDPELKLFYLRLQRDVARLWGTNGANIQARLLCGEWDPLGDRGNMATWRQALPQLAGRMSFVAGGHFLPEHHPEMVARAIYELLVSPGEEG